MTDIAQTLSPAERIRKRPDFERVYNQGLKSPGRFMTLFLLKNGGAVSRLGTPASHGCVRLETENAKAFYELVQAVGPGNTRVIVVRDAATVADASAKRL